MPSVKHHKLKNERIFQISLTMKLHISISFNDTLLKERYGNYKNSFSHKRSTNATKLPKYVHELQKQRKQTVIVWNIVKKRKRTFKIL